MRVDNPDRPAVGVPQRARRLFVAYVLLIAALLIRTAYLGVVRHRTLKAVSESNRLRLTLTHPTRGRIYDRGHRLLVDNRLSWSVAYTPAGNPAADSTLGRLAALVGVSFNEIRQVVAEHNVRRHTPVPLLRDVPFPIVARIYEHQTDLKNVVVQKETRRRYPFGSSAAHLLGYLGEVSPDGLAVHQRLGHDYAFGDLVGRSGIERKAEGLLRGHSGVEYVEVDARGRRTGWTDPAAGRDVEHGLSLVLTLDIGLQQAIQEAFPPESRGAVVALDPRTGAIRALASFPALDPTLFSGIMSAQQWRSLTEDPDRSLVDRTLAGTYPPASIMKLVTAAAGLEEGVIAEDTLLEPCELPGWRLGKRVFRCWKPHGSLTVVKAIARSCDVFFYQVGVRLGLDGLDRMASRLGLGRVTGSGLPGEQAGLLPDRTYYDRRRGKRGWLEPSQVVNLAIGQGELMVTPLQIAVVTAVFANRGRIVTPFATERVHPLLQEEGMTASHVSPQRVRGLSERVIEIVRSGMEQAVTDAQGTARALDGSLSRITLGAKTGTAQNPLGESHAWFTGFAPFEDPELVVTVLVENGGAGSESAMPVAAAAFQAYFGSAGGTMTGVTRLNNVAPQRSRRRR